MEKTFDVDFSTPEEFEAMIAYIYHNGTDWKKKTAVELFEISKLANFYDVTGLMTQVKVVISPCQLVQRGGASHHC